MSAKHSDVVYDVIVVGDGPMDYPLQRISAPQGNIRRSLLSKSTYLVIRMDQAPALVAIFGPATRNTICANWPLKQVH